MDVRIKALLVLLPFAAAIYVGMAMLQPAFEEQNQRDLSIQEKTGQKEDLEKKLAGSEKLTKRQQELTKQIDALRGSVPKAPEIDLLTIDLEKMCKEAGMNMVSISGPKDASGQPRRTDEDRSQYLKSKQDNLKNALKGNLAGGAGAGGTTEAAEPPKAELDQTSKQFIVTGDFNGLQKLCHELETYQRVVRIDDISFRLPKKDSGKDKVRIDDAAPAEGEEAGDPNNLFITMTLTTFFLP